jgi:predicted lysophospholipase L1 biosynthesis ABC-type transport system permease subunit
VRVVGTAERAPTMLDARPRFVVVPLDPFLVALAAAVPGAGRPSEMWIAAPSPERLAETRAALADAPFRFAAVTAREDLVAARSGDPLSQAIVWALVVAAVAGLVLSVGGLVLGAVTDLRDERGELADLETQGVAPSALRRHVVARSAWLAIAGTTAGLVVGTLLAIVVTGSLALDAEGLPPIPPLRVVIPVLPLVGLAAALVTTVLAAVAWLAGRAYGHPTLGERRAGRDRAMRSTAWRRDAERVDG